jgi:hypothetical protein
MKLLRLGHLFFGLLNQNHLSDKFIKNVDLPSCKKCIRYLPSVYHLDFGSNMNRCSKFGEKNMISDEIKYDFVESCRKDEKKCGEKGEYFEEEPNLVLKLTMHRLAYLTPYFFTVCLFLLPVFLTAQLE